MERYKDLGRNSNVNAFEIGNDFINVQFKDGSIYKYTYISAGSSNIEHMKKLAITGKGLNSYINTNVKKRYSLKIR